MKSGLCKYYQPLRLEKPSNFRLERDGIRLNRHRALGFCLSMIFSENRYTLFRIMLLEQSKVAQFAAHRLRHRRDASRRRLAEIRRNGVVGQVAPALERAHRPRRHRDHLGLHHQAAASNAVAVAKRFDCDDLFARGDLSADHPVQRTASEDFLDPLRRHPGDVHMTLRKALFPGRAHALGDPSLEFLDGLAANGKLDQMKRHHVGKVSDGRCSRGHIGLGHLQHAVSAHVKPKAAPDTAYPLISQIAARPGRACRRNRPGSANITRWRRRSRPRAAARSEPAPPDASARPASWRLAPLAGWPAPMTSAAATAARRWPPTTARRWPAGEPRAAPMARYWSELWRRAAPMPLRRA